MALSWKDTFRLFQTFAVAGLGAWLFHIVGFPAAPLTGAAVASTIAAIYGVHIGLPVSIRTACFLLLGISIGATVTPEVLEGARRWPFSLCVLGAGLVASMYACRTVLETVFGVDRYSATLASAPGHLSFAIAMAAEGRGNVTFVALSQSIRLLVVTLVVPPVIVYIMGAGGNSALALLDKPLAFFVLLILLSLSYVTGLVFLKIRVPAAHLMAGIFVGAFGQLSGLATGAPANWILFIALMAMGALIGSRFDGISLETFQRYLLAGLSVTAILLLFAILEAWAIAALLGYRLDLLIAAYAPGGIETMAAISVQTGLDSTFVAAHHVARLLFLTLLVPLFLARTSAT